jgi:hypothetical protein
MTEKTQSLGHAIIVQDDTAFCVLCGKIVRPEHMLEDCPGAVGMTPLEHMAATIKYLYEQQ